jgi:hypothetical protein
MQELTPEGQRTLQGIAERHGVSTDAALTLLRALVAGRGAMAQFNHPELGGMGQWSQGGMTMVGDMFNQALRARVDALCTELASLLRTEPSIVVAAPSQSQSQSQAGVSSSASLFVSGAGAAAGAWWPTELGNPSSAGAQNDLRYAVFPATRRLAIERGGRVTVYDTGDHMISGVSQQQSGDQSLTFTSQRGLVRLADLPVLQAERPRSGPSAEAEKSRPQPTPAMPSQAAAASPPSAERSSGDVLATLERLAELHRKGVLTEEEFTAKKAELLSRI